MRCNKQCHCVLSHRIICPCGPADPEDFHCCCLTIKAALSPLEQCTCLIRGSLEMAQQGRGAAQRMEL